ncbi:MAG: hypothetical protein HYU64_19335, partial [Armatimonadetes bacterium]|nr:hypothetical protein [Armatimonadota bacterium]
TLEETYVETPSRTSRKISKPVRASIPGPIRIFVKALNTGKNEVKKAAILCLYLDSEGKELNREEQTLTDIGPAKAKDVIFFWSNPSGLPTVNYKLSVTRWE